MLNLLAIDLGASSGRVMRAAFNGNTIQLEEVRRFKNHPLFISGGVFWNVYSLFQEVKWGISDAAQNYNSIASLAVDSWAVDFGLLDASGYLIGLPRHYRDPRNIRAMNEVVHRIGKAQLFDRTGIQINPINSLYQLYAMRDEAEAVLSTADGLLMIPDLLNYFLSGVKVTEFTNASTTQFLRPTGDWDTELLKTLHLPYELLPKITLPGTILGPVRDSELLKFKSLTALKVVQTTSHDTASAVVSVPYENRDVVYISSGTWSLMGTTVRQPVINERTREFNFTNEGGFGNYRLLKNVMGLWLIQETERALRAGGQSMELTDLIQAAEKAKPFQYVFNPDDTRLLQPADMPTAIRQICQQTGQTPPENNGSLVRGIFESLALKYRQVLEELELVTGKHYSSIHIVGGGAKNRLLSQLTADACQRVVVTGPIEASATGNVVGQLIALGEIKTDSQITALIRQSVKLTTFEPVQVDEWQQAYERFRVVSTKQAETNMSI